MNIESLYKRYLETGLVSTDTRNIIPGSVFFALKGPTYNANAFAEEALAKGASYAVVDEAAYVKNEKTILVDNSLAALQDLARHHRNQLTIPIIGLTGSNGKTTSKELLNAVLSKKFNTQATKGNLNNHIGVPLTILSLNTNVELAIIEMGANHVGEIAFLCDICNPTHGFITNIGKAHIGTFGGFENIIRGKSELYQHLITKKGVVFINSQNPLLANMAKRFAAPLFYPAKGDYYHCELLDASPFLNIKTEDGAALATQLIGDYNFENIAAALCIGKFFQVPVEKANEAIAEYVPSNMRSQLIIKNSNTIILDAYNANPSSMQAAIESLASMAARKKIAILGDMFELEEEAEQEHGRLGTLLKQGKFDEVYLCGQLIKAAVREIPTAHYFETRELLLENLRANPIKEATILIKASRGMRLEACADVL
jgi:UDP-N-acetylmuramoyl-tripeptide--D-alanyl-D-alanine ligase